MPILHVLHYVFIQLFVFSLLSPDQLNRTQSRSLGPGTIGLQYATLNSAGNPYTLLSKVQNLIVPLNDITKKSIYTRFCQYVFSGRVPSWEMLLKYIQHLNLIAGVMTDLVTLPAVFPLQLPSSYQSTIRVNLLSNQIFANYFSIVTSDFQPYHWLFFHKVHSVDCC